MTEFKQEIVRPEQDMTTYVANCVRLNTELKSEIDIVEEELHFHDSSESKPDGKRLTASNGFLKCKDPVCDNNQGEKYDCVLCLLLEKGFSTLSFVEQKDIIDKGRPKPALKNLTKKIKTCTRYFNPKKTYEQCEWLTGCDGKCKLFCWPCLLFVNVKSVWNRNGFSDLNNLYRLAKKHVMTLTHLQAVIKEKVFGKTLIEYTIDKQFQISDRQHNELVDKNREALKRLIDIVCFLGQHELNFRRHKEESDTSSTNRGNFEDLVSLIAKYDVCLKSHLEQSNVFRSTLNHNIQNDLISAVATVILDKIKREIKHARYIAVILDETTDMANSSQLSTVVRYLRSDGTIHERFLGFLNVPEDRTAEALYKIICDIIKDVDASEKFIAQSYSYDGATVMAGQLKALQARIRETFPRALFVHQQINSRFNNLNNIKFVELCDFTAYKENIFFPEKAFKSLLHHYGHLFDKVQLRTQLTVIYKTKDINTKKNATELLYFLKNAELEKAYAEVLKLCELVLTIPATSSASAKRERSFSAVKRIKKFVKNSTVQDRLSKVSLLSIESDLIREMSGLSRFYENVTNEFGKKEKRIELHYKEVSL